MRKHDSISSLVLRSEEVVALLIGNKTRTSRVILPQPDRSPLSVRGVAQGTGDLPSQRSHYLDAYCGEAKVAGNPRGMSHNWYWWTPQNRLGDGPYKCPFGKPGDLLWVKEELYKDPIGNWRYKADGGLVYSQKWGNNWPTLRCGAKQMLRAASRINLRINNIRVQRLNDVTEEEACREVMCKTFVGATNILKELLAEIYKRDKAVCVDDNPYLWVCEHETL